MNSKPMIETNCATKLYFNRDELHWNRTIVIYNLKSL